MKRNSNEPTTIFKSSNMYFTVDLLPASSVPPYFVTFVACASGADVKTFLRHFFCFSKYPKRGRCIKPRQPPQPSPRGTSILDSEVCKVSSRTVFLFCSYCLCSSALKACGTIRPQGMRIVLLRVKNHTRSFLALNCTKHLFRMKLAFLQVWPRPSLFCTHSWP